MISDPETNAARELAAAWVEGVQIPAPSIRLPLLDRAAGYRIQADTASLLVDHLGYRVGWKLGLMSPSAGAEPFCGPLHERMLVGDGGLLDFDRAINPRIEVELALIAGTDVGGIIDADDAARLPFEVAAAFEIIDDRVVQPAGVPDAIADMATMRQAVIGSRRRLSTLGDIDASLAVDGEIVARGRLSDLRDPFEGVAWLARHLASHGERVRAGDVILTGSMTGQIPLRPSTRYEGIVADLPAVTVDTVSGHEVRRAADPSTL